MDTQKDNGRFASSAGAPMELKVTAKGRVLEVAWDGGARSCLGAGFLRDNCRSAGAVRAAIDAEASRADDTRIAGLHLIGNYGVNLVFSDGEDRGIYPWAYLRELSARSP